MRVMPDVEPPRDRLTEDEARERAALFDDVHYELDLDLPDEGAGYSGVARIRFGCRAPARDSFLDFTGQEVLEAHLNGAPLEIPADRGFRIPLPGDRLEPGNELTIRWRNAYDRTGAGFHRFVDPEDGETYLFTDLEPFCAHRLFPCFDQPDLKATYRLRVTAPARWHVISNAAQTGSEAAGAGRARRTYGELPAFSTYLFALVAGPFAEVRDNAGGLDLGLFCRRSLRPHLDPAEIFEVTRQGFGYYEEAFGCPYPWGAKYDQLFVPEYNSGAMENVACVTFNEAYVFRDPPTESQRLTRAEVILHELAHMWFGDLVTMRWWDGLWLSESFATFISFLALDEATRFTSGWEAFLGTIKSWAMREDQKPTTHPIAGGVPDTEQTFLNFDGITYGKGAAALKQLRAAVGPEAFTAGLRLYFRRHAYGNTTLADFLAAISKAAGTELRPWASLWLETSGTNVIRVERGPAGSVTLHQEPGNGDGVLRPHTLQVEVLEPRDGRLVSARSRRVQLSGERIEVPGVVPPDDLGSVIWPNGGDHAYARFVLDEMSRLTAVERIGRIAAPLVRMGLWETLWQMCRDGLLAPASFLAAVREGVPAETGVEVAETTLRNGAIALFRYTPPARHADHAGDRMAILLAGRRGRRSGRAAGSAPDRRAQPDRLLGLRRPGHGAAPLAGGRRPGGTGRGSGHALADPGPGRSVRPARCRHAHRGRECA